MNTTVLNTAIYGGAFNPPTLAHAQVVQKVLEQTSIEHIIINPSGEREDKNFGVSPEKRKKMMELFCKILQESGNNISLETHFLEGKSGSFTTTRAEEKFFREQLGASPSFIFGNDLAANMSWWSENEDRFIQEKLKKIFINRPGYSFDFEANGFREYTLLDIPNMLEVSSTTAREMIAHKRSVEGILFPEIQAEIEKEKLYQ